MFFIPLTVYESSLQAMTFIRQRPERILINGQAETTPMDYGLCTNDGFVAINDLLLNQSMTNSKLPRNPPWLRTHPCPMI